MPITEETINEYVYSSEKVIELQRKTIATLRETIEEKKKLHNTLIEYVQCIYKGLQSTNPEIKANAMWHLANLAQHEETK